MPGLKARKGLAFMKPGTVLIWVGVIGCAVAGVWLVKREAVRDVAPKQTARAEAGSEGAAGPGASVAPATGPEAPGAEAGPPAPERKQEPALAAPPLRKEARPQGGPSGSAGGSSKKQEEVADPLARVALSFVGADPLAEAYWYAAINDPSLSAHERQDLIEDLNEDGLSDPQRPGLEDLPLILSRLALIEQVALDAMDKVNADAFAEAYKDLSNMAGGLIGGSGPGR